MAWPRHDASRGSYKRVGIGSGRFEEKAVAPAMLGQPDSGDSQKGDMTDQVKSESTPGVGALLRASRIRYGLEIDEVAGVLRIRRRFIEAIEDGKLDQLPGASSTLGFVKTYAEHLGLDGDEVVRRCRAESIAVDKKTRLNFPTPLAERSMPSGSIVIAGALVAMVAYGSWYTISTQDGVIAELISPLPERLQSLAPTSETVAEPAAAQARAGDPAPAQSPSIAATTPFKTGTEPRVETSPTASMVAPLPATTPSPAPIVVTPTAPIAVASTPPVVVPPAATPSMAAAPVATPVTTPSPMPPAPTPALARNLATEFAGAPGPATAPPSSAPQAAPVETAAAVDPNSRITVRATLPSWIQVRDEAGNEFLVTRLMRPGDSLSIPDRPGLRLLTGNAGALEILVDGRIVPPIGPAGAVRRDVILDAARLSAGTASSE